MSLDHLSEPSKPAQKKTQKKTGLARILAASTYSWAGLKTAFAQEAAFRQECLLFILLLIGLIFLPFDLHWKAILLFSQSLVLVTEILNSSIESIVDLASPEFHNLAKASKDMGSAAVLLCLLLTLALWTMALSTLI